MEYFCQQCDIKKPEQFFKSINGKVYCICNKCLKKEKKVINYYDYLDVKKYKK